MHNLGLLLVSWRLGISVDAALNPKGVSLKRSEYAAVASLYSFANCFVQKQAK
jgi:hypothetical protein